MKTAREKWYITYKGTPERLTADFPAETVEARGSGIIIKLLREREKKASQSKVLYLAKISFKNKGK